MILVEGRSGKAALEILADRCGLVLGSGGMRVVAMGSAASIGHFLDVLGPRAINARLAGPCDVGQKGYVRGCLLLGGQAIDLERTSVIESPCGPQLCTIGR